MWESEPCEARSGATQYLALEAICVMGQWFQQPNEKIGLRNGEDLDPGVGG